MFRTWCNTHARRVGGSEITHVLMDGGILSVPWSKVDEFNRVYVRSILSGEKLFVVEQKTQHGYNFFVDIDYKDEEDALEMEQIKTISTIIYDTVKPFGAQRCIVSTALPKKVSGGKIKTGVHLNFPGFVVNQRSAVALMHRIVEALCRVYSGVDWTKVIDDAVYGNPLEGTKGSGFRSPWSHKKGKHVDCVGKGCDGCKGSGKTVESEYLSVFVDEGDSLTYVDQDITLEKLEMTTIRVREGTPLVADVPDIVIADVAMVAAPSKQIKIKNEGSFTKAQSKDEVFPELIPVVETFIREYLPGQRSSRVHGIFKFKTIYLIKTNSKYCENLGREHGSNHVWFKIESGGTIVQKCFCTCDTTVGRQRGLCKDFTGRANRLSPSIVTALFPEKNLCKIKTKRSIYNY